MATQATLGVTKFVILVSAGLAGSVLIKNNKLGELIGDLTKVRWISISRCGRVLLCCRSSVFRVLVAIGVAINLVGIGID